MSAFGDFKADYLIDDRIGIRVLRDPYSNKPYVMLYTTKRVGGGVLDPNAIRVLKVPAEAPVCGLWAGAVASACPQFTASRFPVWLRQR